MYYISPLPHLYHTSTTASQLKLLGLTSTSTTPPKCGTGPTKYTVHLTSWLYPTSTTLPPTKITGINLYLYHTPKMW